MDFWDLTRLLLRRWYFAVPMLLVSVMAAFLVGSSVEPDYSAKGYLQLIPPHAATSATAPAVNDQTNPWLNLGSRALGNAAVLKVTDGATLDTLVKNGLSDNVTVHLDDSTPLVIIEGIGTSPAQATATVRQMIKLLNDDIALEQQRYGASAETSITTLTLADGSDVKVVSSKVTRILVVAGGVALLLTTATTIGLDALLRRRTARRLGHGGSLSVAPRSSAGPSRSAERDGAAPRPRLEASDVSIQRSPAAGSLWSNQAEATATGSDEGGVPGEYQIRQVDREGETAVETTGRWGAAEKRISAPDETVVLPLSYGRRPGPETRNGR